jgi:hypothetical protein
MYRSRCAAVLVWDLTIRLAVKTLESDV